MIYLELHPARPACTDELGLVVDALDDSLPYRLRRDEQRFIGRLSGIAGEHVEQRRQVRGNHRVGGEEAQILVLPRGFRIVVSGPDVTVAANGTGLLPDHKGKLAV